MSYIGGDREVNWSDWYENAFDSVEYFQVSIALVSMGASLLVLLTGVAFYREMVCNKIYMFMIMEMNFSDFVANIGATIGFPQHGTLCQVQAGITVFFARASWIWCLTICATLYSQLVFRKIYIQITAVNFIIWGINILLELLPIMANGVQTYGSTKLMYYSSRQGKMMCSLMSVNEGEMWRIIAVEGPLIFVLVAMIYLVVMLFLKLKPSMPPLDSDPTGAKRELVLRIRKVIKNILFYPAVMFVSWAPQAIVFFAYYAHPNRSQRDCNFYFFLSVLFRAFGFSFGLLLAVVFFTRSKEAQVRWYELIKSISIETGLWYCLFPADEEYDEKDEKMEAVGEDEEEGGHGGERGRSGSVATAISTLERSITSVLLSLRLTRARGDLGPSPAAGAASPNQTSPSTSSTERSTAARKTSLRSTRRSIRRPTRTRISFSSDFDEDRQTMRLVDDYYDSKKLSGGILEAEGNHEDENRDSSQAQAESGAAGRGGSGTTQTMTVETPLDTIPRPSASACASAPASTTGMSNPILSEEGGKADEDDRL